jgi:hypothetical protein
LSFWASSILCSYVTRVTKVLKERTYTYIFLLFISNQNEYNL